MHRYDQGEGCLHNTDEIRSRRLPAKILCGFGLSAHGVQRIAFLEVKTAGSLARSNSWQAIPESRRALSPRSSAFTASI
jgi:hypothetical protein